MPADAGFLTVFAEIAIALAGFASLVSVIGARAGGDPPMLDANRLRNLVDTSLLVVVFSLVPMVLMVLGFDAEVVWRASCAAYAASLLAWGLVAQRRERRLRAAGIRIRIGWALCLWSVYATGVIILAAGVFEPVRAGGFYTLGLLLNLIGCSLIFMVVISSILVPLFQDAAND